MGVDGVDADRAAMSLKPGSVDRMHGKMVKTVARFIEENAQSGVDPQTAVAVIATHMFDMLFEVAKLGHGDLQPGQFQRWVAAIAGIVERGEHRPVIQ